MKKKGKTKKSKTKKKKRKTKKKKNGWPEMMRRLRYEKMFNVWGAENQDRFQ